MQVQFRGTPALQSAGYQKLESEDGLKNNLPTFSGPQNEIEAYNDFTKAINKTQDSRPSLIAKLDKEVVKYSKTIQMIDQIFLLAFEDYKKSLNDARNADLEKSENPSPRNNIVDFRDAVATGAQIMTRFIPNVMIIQHIFALVLPLIGASMGMICQGHYTRLKIDVENSEHRQKWLNEVRILEAQRKKMTRNLIVDRVLAIATDIDEHPDNEHPDLVKPSSLEKRFDELRALAQLYQNMNPDTPLLIQGKNVAKYIEMVNADATEELHESPMSAPEAKKIKSRLPSSNSKLTITNIPVQGTAEAKKKK